MSEIQVRGYSERGMINAICYEIRYSANGRKMLQDLLGLCTFPHAKPDFTRFRSATLIIEQSFSDFGDLDALFLLEGDCTQAICLEAKVKTYEANGWSLHKEWRRFREPRIKKDRNSNLFTQLYRKMRLLKQVANMDEKLAADTIAERWSLGENAVIRQAAHALSKNCSEVWMVALVPETKATVQRFFETEPASPPDGLPDWAYANFGYLTWHELADYCTAHAEQWPETVANFEYNRGQIFAAPLAEAQPRAGDVLVWKNSPTGPRQVTVKNGNKHNTRIYLTNTETIKVPNDELERA